MKPVSRNVKKWLIISGLAALTVAFAAAVGCAPWVSLAIGSCQLFLSAPL